MSGFYTGPNNNPKDNFQDIAGCYNPNAIGVLGDTSMDGRVNAHDVNLIHQYFINFSENMQF